MSRPPRHRPACPVAAASSARGHAVCRNSVARAAAPQRGHIDRRGSSATTRTSSHRFSLLRGRHSTISTEITELRFVLPRRAHGTPLRRCWMRPYFGCRTTRAESSTRRVLLEAALVTVPVSTRLGMGGTSCLLLCSVNGGQAGAAFGGPLREDRFGTGRSSGGACAMSDGAASFSVLRPASADETTIRRRLCPTSRICSLAHVAKFACLAHWSTWSFVCLHHPPLHEPHPQRHLVGAAGRSRAERLLPSRRRSRRGSHPA